MYSPMQFFDLPQQLRIVTARHGMLLVNLQDHFIGQAIAAYGEYSETELNMILQYLPAGRDVVEIGANMGSHSLPLAKVAATQGRRLMAIEPQPVIFQQLCANLAINHIHNAIALNMACSESASNLYFSRQDYSAVGNFGGVALRLQGKADDERIAAQPLDELLDNSWDVGLLKIDVEGMERVVLLGAQQTISRCRPVIYLENDQPDKSRALIEQLWQIGYKIWFHLPPLFNPDNYAQRAENMYDDKVSINMLCLPEELANLPEATCVNDSAWHPLNSNV